MKCGWCQQIITRNLTMKEILLPLTIIEGCCLTCQQRLKRTSAPACSTCQKMGDVARCEDCVQWQQLFPDYDFSHHAFFVYDDSFQEWVYQYKFLGDYRLRKTFIPEMKKYFRQEKESLICPIPLSQARFEERGFNQTEGVLSAAQIPMVQLLKKEKHTEPQAQKNRTERLAIAQPFTPTEEVHLIKGKKVILFDDVYTTGRTLFHAAALLMAYEPAQIRTVSLAR